MSDPRESKTQRYDDFYQDFDSTISRQIRREAYGKDIGQHSWVTAEELEEYIPWLKLEDTSRLLDLGCGPGGPLTFLVGRVHCRGSGVELSEQAIAAARARTVSLELEGLVEFHQADLNAPLLFANGSFDAMIALDVILHLRDRVELFREAVRVLVPGGRFLFTDAGVITGSISNKEIELRAIHGHTQFVPPGFNEKVLAIAGLRLIERSDRTASLLKNAQGRLAARLAHRTEMETLEGKTNFERQQRYLQTVAELAQRGAMSRMMYLAEKGPQEK
jgi:SAM-dependent methyltransferase